MEKVLTSDSNDEIVTVRFTNKSHQVDSICKSIHWSFPFILTRWRICNILPMLWITVSTQKLYITAYNNSTFDFHVPPFLYNLYNLKEILTTI